MKEGMKGGHINVHSYVNAHIRLLPNGHEGMNPECTKHTHVAIYEWKQV